METGVGSGHIQRRKGRNLGLVVSGVSLFGGTARPWDRSESSGSTALLLSPSSRSVARQALLEGLVLGVLTSVKSLCLFLYLQNEWIGLISVLQL